MSRNPARVVPHLKYGRILKMAVNLDQTVDLVIRVSDCDHEDRNAIHQAMKRAKQVGLVFEVAEQECYNAE